MIRLSILFSGLLLLATFCGSKSDSGVEDGHGSFSYEKGHIAFTHFTNNVGSLYYTKNLNSVARQLTFPEKGWDLTMDLSQDLSKILYFNYPKANYEICNVCLYDLRSGRSDTLLKGGALITDICLSNNGKYVYYLNASEIKNYSPVARKAPHGLDIYELNIETKISRKLTNLRAYSIQVLTTSYSDTLIGASLFDDETGLIMVSTNTGKHMPLIIDSPRNDIKQLFVPLELRKDSILYVAPYELYKHNLKTNKSEFILRCPDGYHFGVIQPDEKWENILLNSGDKLYSYNVPGKKLMEVQLRIK